ncbi:MAG: hypothetical protein H6849_00875 [Alphaproteobacteria bacterium]|nr:MAG: hypothetical protein H6849_00875 [Alphaproteobacteria bacterium]
MSRLRGGVDLITTRMGDGTGVMYPVESAPVMMPVYDSHYDRRHTRRRAGYAVSTAAGLAVGLLTQGLGVSEGLAGILGTSGSVSSGIAGGITAAASTITANSIGSGSLGQGIGSTFGRDGLRGMGVGALSAGVLDGLGVTGPSVTFGSRVRASAVKVPVTTGLEIGIGRRDPVEAFRSGVTGGVVDVFGGTAAQAIGGAYIPGSGQSGLGYVSHKLLHGALGASGGAILGRDDPLRGALSGGIGAIIGEMVIEATAPDPVVEVGRIREEIRRDKPWLSSEHVSREALRRYESQVRFHRDVAQVLSTLGAGVGGNPAVASQMSANALDNNFIVTTLLVAGGLCTLYETYESYQRAGVSGAATTLTQAAVLSLLGAQAFKGVVCVGGKVFARVGPQLVELSQPALRSLAQSPVGQKFFKSGVERNLREGYQLRVVKLMERVSPRIRPHGNSVAYQGETHVYLIRDARTGHVFKVGESMRGVNELGLSHRAEEQVRRLLRNHNRETFSHVRKMFSSKAEAKAYETQLIQTIRRFAGKDALPGNKGVH